ncbi:MAG: 6,7-dimethyl-8-ribityllumazine synthase [Gemmatimonas sp.]|nr:6,7-dimethyl-8-ribityllumazine synthase [Gemmatimonas sp.]
MPEFEGMPTGSGRRFVVVASRFNEAVTQSLVTGALDCLVRHGARADDVDVVWVPGAWELPAAVARVLMSERYDAVVACGAVIRGETPHFDFVAGEASRGLSMLQGEYGVPIGFALLTTDTLEQALQRAGGGHGNKGWDAALAAMQMADLFGLLDAGNDAGDD